MRILLLKRGVSGAWVFLDHRLILMFGRSRRMLAKGGFISVVGVEDQCAEVKWSYAWNEDLIVGGKKS